MVGLDLPFLLLFLKKISQIKVDTLSRLELILNRSKFGNDIDVCALIVNSDPILKVHISSE